MGAGPLFPHFIVKQACVRSTVLLGGCSADAGGQNDVSSHFLKKGPVTFPIFMAAS